MAANDITELGSIPITTNTGCKYQGTPEPCGGYKAELLSALFTFGVVICTALIMIESF